MFSIHDDVNNLSLRKRDHRNTYWTIECQNIFYSSAFYFHFTDNYISKVTLRFFKYDSAVYNSAQSIRVRDH
jgi:hypothetical protein